MPTATITPEQRQAIEDAGHAPVRLEDPETKARYILMTAEDFERVRSLVDRAGATKPDNLQAYYPMMDRVASAEGWDDPAMDIYDDEDSASQG